MLSVALCFVATWLLGLSAARDLQADDWPQWGGPERDLVWRETGIVKKFSTDGLLPRVWSTPLAEGYSGPAVADGKVYITDYVREELIERVFCLDAEDGKEIWKHTYPSTYTVSYPAGPRSTPVVDGNRVYTIGAMGDMFCLNVADGKVKWKKNLPEEFGTKIAIWGFVASPLVDGDQLITLVGGEKNSLVVSFDKHTGKERWRSLEDTEVGYAPPVIFTFGGVRQLIVWHPSAVSSIDPTDGKVFWEVPFPAKAGLTIATPRQSGNRLFVTAFYDGPLMIEVDGKKAHVLWKGKSQSEVDTDGLHSIIPTPVFDGTHIYGVCSYGQLRCLDARTGERIWETFEATGKGRWWNAFLIPHEDRFFLHNEQGDLIIAKLTPDGYHEISRAKLVEPTRPVNRRMTIWSHPAFAMKSVFARNDNEIVRVDLSEK
jgi:outer membrane protein assembly factor BamB